MTLKFHQTWTGEPHSVTFGAMVDKNIKGPLLDLLDNVAAGKEPLPDEPPDSYDPSFWDERLPGLFSAEEGLSQGAAKPCYAKTEKQLPLDQKACAKANRVQPDFTGTYAYYSSGFIPFEGERGNTFEMKIADDAKEGTYFYYCNVHGIPMGGKVTVKKGADVESQASMNRRGRAESKRTSEPLLKVYKKEKAGQSEYKLPLAGSGDDSTDSVEGIVNEFTPRSIEAKVNEKVTWTFIGNHTISFNVPPYTPLFVFNKKGDLEFNESLDKAAGGWPGVPEGHDEYEDEAPPPIHLDAGEFDGSGKLRSSGVGFNTGDTYSVTFTKAGTYPYACLIHPGMIGKVVVS
jgi:plastocyanin